MVLVMLFVIINVCFESWIFRFFGLVMKFWGFGYRDDDEVDIFSVCRPFPISAGVDICLGAPPQLDIDDQLHAPYYNIIYHNRLSYHIETNN